MIKGSPGAQSTARRDILHPELRLHACSGYTEVLQVWVQAMELCKLTSTAYHYHVVLVKSSAAAVTNLVQNTHMCVPHKEGLSHHIFLRFI